MGLHKVHKRAQKEGVGFVVERRVSCRLLRQTGHQFGGALYVPGQVLLN